MKKNRGKDFANIPNMKPNHQTLVKSNNKNSAPVKHAVETHYGLSRKAKNSNKTPNRPANLYVEGESSIVDYLKLAPQLVTRIYFKHKIGEACLNLAQRHHIEVIALSSEDIREYHPRVPVFAEIKMRTIDEKGFFRRIGERERDLIVVCDHITDPRNMGAIIRSAAFFGIRSVVVPEMRQAGITQAMINTAQGGFAKTELIVVKNIARFVQDIKEYGYWVAAADLAGSDLSPESINFNRLALVLGAEDLGVSRLVKKVSDVMIRIPADPAGITIDSLNVSVAAGVFFFCWQLGHKT